MSLLAFKAPKKSIVQPAQPERVLVYRRHDMNDKYARQLLVEPAFELPVVCTLNGAPVALLDVTETFYMFQTFDSIVDAVAWMEGQ